jgi:hypothetical protein
MSYRKDKELTELPTHCIRFPPHLWELLQIDAKRNLRSTNSHLIVVLSALYGVVIEGEPFEELTANGKKYRPTYRLIKSGDTTEKIST